MNEATEKLIEELAAKLGTTVEHLWAVLIRQAPISAVVGLTVDAVFIWLVVLGWKKLSKVDFDSWDSDMGKGMLYAGLSLATAIVVACVLCELPVLVAGLLNPEYWALKQVMP